MKKKIATRPLSGFDELDAAGIGAGYRGMAFEQEPEPEAKIEPKGRTWGEAATDLGAGALQGALGVARLGARIGDAFTHRQGDENPAIRFLNEYGDAVDMQKSEKLREEEQKSQQAVAAAGQRATERFGDGVGGKVARFGAEFGTGAYEAVSNPTLLANSLAEQIPMMGAMKAGQKAAELFAKGATRVAPGAMATSVGKRIAGNAGLGGAVATGMALQGSDVKGETYKRMMELPLDMWRQNPEFVALSKSIGEDSAKIEIAGRESSKAGWQSAGTSLATSFLPGGTAMERALVGGKKIPIAAVPQAIAGEFAQEGTEEGTGRLAGNNAVSKINTKQDMLDGVGGASGQGGAVGGILGGGSTLARVGLQNYGNKLPVDPAIAAAKLLAEQKEAARKVAVSAAHTAASTPNSPIARAAAAANPLTPEEAWAKAQELDAQAALDEANGVTPVIQAPVDVGGSVGDGQGGVNEPAPIDNDPTVKDSLTTQPAFDVQAAQEQYRAETLAAQQAQDDELNAQAEAALAKMAQRKQQTRPVNEVVSDGGYLHEGTQDGDVLNGLGKPFTIKMGALQEAKRQARENGGNWTVAPVFDGYVARKKEASNVGVQDGTEPRSAEPDELAGDNANAGMGDRPVDRLPEGDNPLGADADPLGQSGEQAGGSDAGAVTPEKQAITDGYALDKTRDSGVRIFRKTDDAGRHMRAINAEGELITSTSNFGEFTISDSYLDYDGPQAFVVSMDNKRGHLTAKNKESGQLIELSPRADKEFADGIPLAKVLETEFSDAGGIKPDGSKTLHTTTVKKSAPTAKQKSNVTTPDAQAQAVGADSGGDWTVAPVFDGFVARKSATNKAVELVESAQAATKNVAGDEVERYQWQRNAEGGQKRGNQQTIQPLTEALFNEYIAPKVSAKSFSDYKQQFPAATHISLVQKADGSVELGAGGVGPIEKLRPSAAPVEKGWVKAVDSFDSPEAVAHGSSADSAIQPKPLAGQPIDKDWTAFHPESGTLDVPRADMPQIEAGHRGAMVNFLKARGIDSTHEEVPTESLKPTQREYSPEKVEKAKGFKGNDRSILVSSDGHVLDGHHQWVAKHEAGEPVKVIRLDAPIDALLSAVREFPSAETTVNSTTQEKANEKAPKTEQEPAKQQAATGAEPVNAAEPDQPAAEPAGASPSEVDLTTVEGVARAVQLKVATNRRKSREKSRKEREAKGYAPNSTPESEQADYEAEISAPPSDMQKQSAAAMLGADPLPLIRMFVNGNFEASEDVFKAITGVKIRGLSAAAKKAALYQWAGWTPEQIDQAEGDVQARKDEAAEKYRQDDLKSAVTGAWIGLDRLKVKEKDGTEMTGQDFVLKTVASGFDKAHSEKRGAAVIYGLTDGGRFTTLKNPAFTAFVKSAIAFGGLDKALAYVNPPKPQAPEGFVDRSIDIGGVKDDGMTAKAFSKPDAQSPVEDAAPAPQVDPPSAEPAPRPKNWENNYGAASKIAEGLNIALRGANGKMKKVPELVAEIKALDVHNSGMEKLAADWAAQDASKNPEKVDTSAEPVQKPDESEQATPNPVSERKSRIASALDNGGHVVGSELRDRNGLRLLILTPEELADMPGDKIRTKPDANMARTQSSASEQVDAAQAEWTRTRDVDRMGIALKAGFKESVAESLSKRAWSSLDVVVQEKLAEAMAETQPTAPTGEDALYTSTAKLTQPQTLDDFIGNVDAGYRAHFEYAGADGRTLWIEKVEGGWVLKSKDDDSTMTSTKGGAGAGGRWSKAQALREAENDAKFRYTEWKPLVPKAEGMFQTPAEKAEIENKQAPTQDMINEALRLEVLNPGRMTATDLAKAIDAAKQRQKEEHARISAQIEAKKKGEATSETAEPKAFTQEDVKAAERQALGVIEAAIDQMKWESAQRFAAKFLPSMGVPVVTGKAKLKAAMADPKINLLAAASDLGIEFAHSVRAALLAKFEGRIATADATPSQVMLNQLLNVDSRLLLNDLDAATHDVDIGFLKALHDKLRDLDIGASHDRKLRKQDRIGYVLQAIQAKETGKGGLGAKKASNLKSSSPAAQDFIDGKRDDAPSQEPSNTIKSSPSEDAAIEAKTTIEQLDAQIKRHEELLGCLG